MKITCKYGGHRTNDDQSCRVSFNRPDGLKYYVNMPAKFNGPGVGVLDWIESEGIEIYLTKKFNHMVVYVLHPYQFIIRLRLIGFPIHSTMLSLSASFIHILLKPPIPSDDFTD